LNDQRFDNSEIIGRLSDRWLVRIVISEHGVALFGEKEEFLVIRVAAVGHQLIH